MRSRKKKSAGVIVRWPSETTRDFSRAKPYLLDEERRAISRARQQITQACLGGMSFRGLRRLAKQIGITSVASKATFDKDFSELSKSELETLVIRMLKLKSASISAQAPYWVKALTKPQWHRTLAAEEVLGRLGIPHERVIKSDDDGVKKLVLTAKLGESIESLLEKQRMEGKGSILSDALLDDLIEKVARMHAAGLSHNHLHKGNVAVVNGEIGFIDLKRATKHSKITFSAISQPNGEVIANDLVELHALICEARTVRKANELLARLIDTYPLDDLEKRDLLREIIPGE